MAFRYFLNDSPKGEYLNLSFKEVQKLKDGPQKREALLKKLKETNFPDGVFKKSTWRNQALILKVLNQNFPEVVNYYVDLK